MKKKVLSFIFILFTISQKNYGARQEDLEKAKFGQENLQLVEANLINAELVKINLKKANLYNADLYGSDLSGANLERAILTNAKLNNSVLQGTNFYKSDLTDADFSCSKYNFKRRIDSFINYIFEGSFNLNTLFNLLKIHTKQTGININFKKVKAINTNFSNCLLVSSNFRKSNLAKAKFNNSILAFSNFSRIQSLQETDFRNTILFGSNFHGSNFEGTNVQNANFYGVKGLNDDQKQYLKNHGAINFEWELEEEPIEEIINPENEPVIHLQ